MTVGLHIYKGMAMGLAIQAVMGPFNLIENPLVKALLFGNGSFSPEDKIFEEKTLAELANDDEVVDESGNTVVKQQLLAASKTSANKKTQSPTDAFEELLLDTWDKGNKADISALMEAITKKNANHRTKENGWTPLMILSGLTNTKAKTSIASAIKQVIALGGNPSITDGEGWNALHWAAFHGSVKAAKELYEYDGGLLEVTDKEGKLPLEMAKQEDNKDVAVYLEEVTASKESATNADASSTKDEVRKRK